MGGPESRFVGKAIDTLHAEILSSQGVVPALRSVLERHRPEEAVMAGLLLRPLPAAFLSLVAGMAPWSRNATILGRIAQNPGSQVRLSLALLPSLFWRDLAAVAASPRVPAPVRQSAEATLRDRLPDLRPGERTALARLATPGILTLLLADADARVIEACLPNPRLRQDQVEAALRQTTASRHLLEAVAASSRWGAVYSIRLALVFQPRTPLHVALGQITSLEPKDLVRVRDTTALRPLIRGAARTVLERRVR